MGGKGTITARQITSSSECWTCIDLGQTSQPRQSCKVFLATIKDPLPAHGDAIAYCARRLSYDPYSITYLGSLLVAAPKLGAEGRGSLDAAATIAVSDYAAAGSQRCNRIPQQSSRRISAAAPQQ